MGEILLTTLGDALGGAVPVNASVTAVASRVRTDGAEVTAPSTVRVHVRDGVPDAPFVLDASGPDWYWTLTIRFVNIARSVVRHVAVPEGVVEWGDLVEVDPATYQPADPTPTLLETIDRQVAAYLVENPAASPEQIEQAVTAWLSENPVEGVTQAELDAALQALALDFAPTVHTHAQSDVDGLTAALGSKVGTDDPRLSDARTPVAHTHEIGDVTGLEDALANAGGGGASTGWIEQSVPAETLGTATIQWFIRRDGAIVHLKARVDKAPAGTSLGVLPSGYRMTTGHWPGDDIAFPLIRPGTNQIVNMLRVQNGNQVSIVAQATTNGTCMVSWPTDDPMP